VFEKQKSAEENYKIMSLMYPVLTKHYDDYDQTTENEMG
jgi:hypothetical protein